jgi:hypothetical protein
MGIEIDLSFELGSFLRNATYSTLKTSNFPSLACVYISQARPMRPA